MYPNGNTEALAAKLNRSVNSVHTMAYKFGIKKTDEFKSEQIKRIQNISTRFKKGSVPANKGKKLSPEKYQKMSSNFFKKGGKPHNTKPIGYKRVTKDGYLQVKIADKKFEMLHVLEWEKHNGPIPPGYAVCFKDKNKQNISIENLELVSRQELMDRNTIHRLPENLKETIILLKMIKKRIYEKQN